MKMKSVAFFTTIAALMWSCLFAKTISAQGREPQNIYRVTVNSRYVLVNGERTKDFFAIGQQIYDSLGRLHTEIDFDYNTHYPNNFRWHYFNGTTKNKTDFFINDKLSRIEEYKWDNDQLKELSIFKVVLADTVFAEDKKTIIRTTEPDTTLTARIEYKYNPNGTVQSAVGYDSKGKKGFKTKYKYDAKGTEISRKVSGKRISPPDSIITLLRVPQYDSLGRVIEEMVTVGNVSKEKTIRKNSYQYDSNGNIIEKVAMDANGKQLNKHIFVYRPDKRIKEKKTYDSVNNLVEHLAWRYEIYKTNDRRQRVFE